MGVTVLHPGMMTTVQDGGRYGYQEYGVPVSGVCDPWAASVANTLVGNSTDEAVLECPMMGPMLRFDTDAVIAVTGADMVPMLDDAAIPNYAAVKVSAGQTLRFGGLACGCRVYIAFAGGLDIPKVLGSRSTFVKAGIGGFGGRALKAGDTLPLAGAISSLPGMKARKTAPEFVVREIQTLRAVPGPQDDMFTEAGKAAFFNEVYTVTPQFDRMGMRLDGAEIEHAGGKADIISDGIAFGAVQVPASGKPIIMLADRQTAGGYSKIANVITVDFGILGQLKAGNSVRFQAVSVEYAQDLLRLKRAALEALRRETARAAGI